MASISAVAASKEDLRVPTCASSSITVSAFAASDVFASLSLVCNSSTALLSSRTSLIEDMDPAPGVRVGRVEAVLGGLLLDGARLARGPLAVRFTSPLTEARGRSAPAAESGVAAGLREADAVVVLGADGAKDARPEDGVGALLVVGVGALGTMDCLRVAAVVGADTAEEPCLEDGIVGFNGCGAVLVDLRRVDVADVGDLADVAAEAMPVPVAFEVAVVGACLTAPAPNVPELMIFLTNGVAGAPAAFAGFTAIDGFAVGLALGAVGAGASSFVSSFTASVGAGMSSAGAAGASAGTDEVSEPFAMLSTTCSSSTPSAGFSLDTDWDSTASLSSCSSFDSVCVSSSSCSGSAGATLSCDVSRDSSAIGVVDYGGCSSVLRAGYQVLDERYVDGEQA